MTTCAHLTCVPTCMHLCTHLHTTRACSNLHALEGTPLRQTQLPHLHQLSSRPTCRAVAMATLLNGGSTCNGAWVGGSSSGGQLPVRHTGSGRRGERKAGWRRTGCTEKLCCLDHPWRPQTYRAAQRLWQQQQRHLCCCAP